MTNEEHHQYICGILLKLVDVLDCAELDALARCTGIRIDEFYPGDCSKYQYRTEQPNNEHRSNENEHSNHDFGGKWDREIHQPAQSGPGQYAANPDRQEAPAFPF
jgi:hypothetical protein